MGASGFDWNQGAISRIVEAMIAEKFPAIQSLSAEDKLILANELWESVESEESTIPFDESVEALLNQRFEHFRKNPETAVSWEDFKKSIGKD